MGPPPPRPFICEGYIPDEGHINPRRMARCLCLDSRAQVYRPCCVFFVCPLLAQGIQEWGFPTNGSCRQSWKVVQRSGPIGSLEKKQHGIPVLGKVTGHWSVPQGTFCFPEGNTRHEVQHLTCYVSCTFWRGGGQRRQNERRVGDGVNGQREVGHPHPDRRTCTIPGLAS